MRVLDALYVPLYSRLVLCAPHQACVHISACPSTRHSTGMGWPRAEPANGSTLGVQCCICKVMTISGSVPSGKGQEELPRVASGEGQQASCRGMGVTRRSDSPGQICCKNLGCPVAQDGAPPGRQSHSESSFHISLHCKLITLYPCAPLTREQMSCEARKPCHMLGARPEGCAPHLLTLQCPEHRSEPQGRAREALIVVPDQATHACIWLLTWQARWSIHGGARLGQLRGSPGC